MAGGHRYPYALGGKPGQVAVPDVTCCGYPPPGGCMPYSVTVACGGLIVCMADRPLGNSVGETGWPWGTCVASAPGTSGPGDVAVSPTSGELLCLPPLPGGRSRRVALSPAVKIVTWLILPVVICLSQRLSHASLSISNLYCETANGSLYQS